MWQLSNYPISITSFIKDGAFSKVDSSSNYFDFNDSINVFLELSDQMQELKFADNAHKYNHHNCNKIVINYYNVAIDILINSKGDKVKLSSSKKYLLHAKKYTHCITPGLNGIVSEIDNALEYLLKYNVDNSNPDNKQLLKSTL